MGDLDRRIEAWAETKYPGADIGHKIRKLGEEVGELAQALIYRESDNNIHRDAWTNAALLEAADCGIVLTHIVRMLGGPGLFEMMELKFEEVELRPTPTDKSPAS